MAADTLYLETGSTDPAYNLAFEEVVLQNRREGNTLLLWQNDHAVVIGQNQNAEGEINRAFVEAHQIHVVRHTTGGGAVYHDLGNLNYSFITDVGDAERLTMERFTRPIVEALQGLGLQAEASGRNDILVEGRKVSGTAQRLLRGRFLYHGTLLFDANPRHGVRGAECGPGKVRVQERKIRAQSDRQHPGVPEDGYGYARLLELSEEKHLAGSGLVEDHLTDEELAAVDELKRTKYDTWEWNFGRCPQVQPAEQAPLGRWHPGALCGGGPGDHPPDRVLRRFSGCQPHGRGDRRPDGHAIPAGGRGGGAGPFPPPGLFRNHHPGPGAGYNILCGLRQRPQKQKERRARRVFSFCFCQARISRWNGSSSSRTSGTPGAGPHP